MSDDPNDEVLMEQLRGLLADPMPDEVLRISEGLFAWRTIDADLAELAEEADAMSGVRAGGTAVAFTFTTDDHVIEVEYDAESGELTIDLGGTWATGLQIVVRDGTPVDIAVDAAGVARLDNVPQEAVQFVISTADGRIKTEWVML